MNTYNFIFSYLLDFLHKLFLLQNRDIKSH